MSESNQRTRIYVFPLGFALSSLSRLTSFILFHFLPLRVSSSSESPPSLCLRNKAERKCLDRVPALVCGILVISVLLEGAHALLRPSHSTAGLWECRT